MQFWRLAGHFGPGAWAAVLALLLVPFVRVRRAAPRQAGVKVLLTLATVAAALDYFAWRVGVTNWRFWAIAGPLLGAEAFNVAQTLGFHYTVWPRARAVPPTDDDPTRRPVFIFIPTVDEGAAVLAPTVQGALAARARFLDAHPHGDVSVVICNDGRAAGRANWREAEEVAERFGVRCITRTKPGGAKAGNIEHARQALHVPADGLLVMFDADMVARPDFLLRIVPPFADRRVGWVQTGQYYHNLDNPVARWANDQQSLFFDVLSSGKAAQNALFICGTNVAVRMDALDEIGGLPQDSVTEDFAASILLHPRWRCVYVEGVLATGLGPLDLPDYFTQQNRWAVGTLGVLRRRWRMLLLPGRGQGLTASQRVQYGLSCTHYLSGLCNLVFLTAPLLYVLAGVSALRAVSLGALLSHFLPYFALSQIAFRYAAGGRAHWRGSVLGFGSTATLVGSLLSVVLGQRLAFVITPKHRKSPRTGRALLPHACAACACVAGLASAWTPHGFGPLSLICDAWLCWTLALLGAVFWLGALDRRAGRAGTKPALTSQSLFPQAGEGEPERLVPNPRPPGRPGGEASKASQEKGDAQGRVRASSAIKGEAKTASSAFYAQGQEFPLALSNTSPDTHTRRHAAMGLTDQYYGASTAGLGKVIQDFGLCDLQGEYLYTAKARGKGVLVVTFYGLNSGPSTRALQTVQQWAGALPPGKWTALAVGEGGRDELSAFQASSGLDGLTFVIDHELYQTRRWGVSHLPMTYVIAGKTGRVLAKVIGDDAAALDAARGTLSAELDTLIAMEAAAKQAEADKKAADAAAKLEAEAKAAEAAKSAEAAGVDKTSEPRPADAAKA